MLNSVLIRQLARPRHQLMLVTALLFAMAALAVVLFYVQPLRETSLVLHEQRLVAGNRQALMDRIAGAYDRAQLLHESLPELMDKAAWEGNLSDFSSAVGDSAVIAGVVLDKESNDVSDAGSGKVYRKTVEFTADTTGTQRFIDELARREMLIVVSHLVMTEDEASDTSVRLVLTSFSGGLR